MPNYSKNDVVLVRYPFTNGPGSKIRPAVVVSAPHPSQDVFLVSLTSRTASLLPGEFALSDWRHAGLRMPTAVKRGLFSIHQRLLIRATGSLSARDARTLDRSLRDWLGLPG